MYVLKRAPSITFSFLRVDSSSGERQPIKHTSQDFRWTRLAPASRKWMSGQAAALAATQDRTPFVNLCAAPRFETSLFPASGDLRLLLTFTYHGCPCILRVSLHSHRTSPARDDRRLSPAHHL